MDIVDLTPQHEEAWLHCLEPWSEEIRDGVERKRAWYEQERRHGLVVRLAIDDDGAVAGMVQATPIERSPVQGEGLLFVHCIWVHGHRQGVGRRQGKGLGQALLAAVEAEARSRGFLGVAAWGLALPVWMKASWFLRQGYLKADRDGMRRLVWKAFGHDATPPTWRRASLVPTPEPGARQVVVTCFDSGWCTLQSANCVRARRAADAEGAQSVTVDTSGPAGARQWGQDYGIYVDEKAVGIGPPLSEDKLRKVIRRRQRKAARRQPLTR